MAPRAHDANGIEDGRRKQDADVTLLKDRSDDQERDGNSLYRHSYCRSRPWSEGEAQGQYNGDPNVEERRRCLSATLQVHIEQARDAYNEAEKEELPLLPGDPGLLPTLLNLRRIFVALIVRHQ